MDIPYILEIDEDGAFCARAYLLPGALALGEGTTREEALEDLKKGLEALATSELSQEILRKL